MHILLGLCFYQSLPVKVSDVTTHYITVNLVPLSQPSSSKTKKVVSTPPVIKPLSPNSIHTQLRQEQRDEALHEQMESSHANSEAAKPSLFTWEANAQPQIDRKNLFVYPQHYYNILAFTLNATELVQVEITVRDERVFDYKILKGAIPNMDDFDKLLKFFPIAHREGIFILNLSKEEYLHDVCDTTDDPALSQMCNDFKSELINNPNYFKPIDASESLAQ